MPTIPAQRMYWKELKTQSVVWIALLAMSVMFAVAVIALVDVDGISTAFDSLLCAAPALFGVAYGAFSFASEDETGTIGVLRRLPITSRQLLRTKLTFGLVGLASFYLVFAAVLLLVTAQVRSRGIDSLGHWHYAFWGLEAFFWSAYFSMRTRSSFAAAAWGAFVVALISFVFEIFELYYPLVAWGTRIAALGFIGLRLIPLCDEWFHDYEVDAGRHLLQRVWTYFARLPRDFGRVAWLTYRENRWLLIGIVAYIATFLVVAVAQGLFWRLNYLEELAQYSRYNYRTQFQGPVDPLLPGFWTVLCLLGIQSLLLAGLGLLVFGTTRQLRGVVLLAHQGVSPRFLAISRFAVFGVLAIGVSSATVAVFLGAGWEWIGSWRWDGSRLTHWVATIPKWCFLGALWSSFHTTKKVVALIAGLILGVLAGSAEFGLTPLIAGLNFPVPIFFWLWMGLAGLTIAFAAAWALSRWSRVFRAAVWCLFPAALIAIYGATAYYRTIDVPDVGDMPLMATPTNVPKVTLVVAPQNIDLDSLFGDSGPNYDTLAYKVTQGGKNLSGIYHPKFQEWLTTEPNSVRWSAKDLDWPQTMYDIFKELEPRIQWVRDKLLAEDCLVRFASSDQPNSMRWLSLGFYAKLKESQPAEALGYLHALQRFSRNLRRYRLHHGGDLQVGSPPLSIWDVADSRESDIRAMLLFWSNLPSVRNDAELLRKALDIVPEPDEDRVLFIYSINRIRDNLLSLQTREPRKPIDSRVDLVLHLLRPWEVRRHKILIEYSARHAARLWQAPPGADNFQLQRKRKRYQGDFLDAFPSEKDFEETAEKRRKLRHQLEQAVERAKTGP